MKLHGRYKGLFTKIEEHIFERHGLRDNTYIVKIRDEYLGSSKLIESARRIRDSHLHKNPIVRIRRKMGTGSIVQDYRTKCGHLIVKIGNNHIGTVKSRQEGEDLLNSILNNPSIVTKSTFSSGHDGATKRERIIFTKSPRPTLLPQPDIGLLLRKIRKKMKITRQNLSQSSGLSLYSIYMIENGHHQPRHTTIQKICKSLTVDEDVFYTPSNGERGQRPSGTDAE